MENGLKYELARLKNLMQLDISETPLYLIQIARFW